MFVGVCKSVPVCLLARSGLNQGVPLWTIPNPSPYKMQKNNNSNVFLGESGSIKGDAPTKGESKPVNEERENLIELERISTDVTHLLCDENIEDLLDYPEVRNLSIGIVGDEFIVRETVFMPTESELVEDAIYQFVNLNEDDKRMMHRVFEGSVSEEELTSYFTGAVGERAHLCDLFIELSRAKPQAGWDLLGIKELSDTLKEGVDRIIAATDRINPNVQAVVNAADNIASVGRDVNESFITWFGKPLVGGMAVLVTVTVLNALEGSFEPSTLRVVKILVAVCGLTYASVDYIKPLVMPWMKTIIPQGGFRDWGPLLLEGVSIATLGCSLDVGWDMTGLMSKLVKLQQQSETIERLTSRVCNWFVEVITKLCEYFGIEVANWLSTNDTEVRKLLEVCSDLMTDYYANPMNLSKTFVDRVTVLSMRVNDLATRVPLGGNTPVRIALSKLQDQVTMLVRAIGDTGSNIGDRDEPGFVIIAGAPGVGKTYLGEFLAAQGVIHMAKEDELPDIEAGWKSQVYPWPNDPKHHDMYMGQWVIQFPDLFCAKDARGVPGGEPQSIVYLVGGQPMNLPAADITKKQRLYMISRMLLAFTNMLYISPNTFDSINNPDAVIRRVNEFGYYMWCNPKYIKRTPDGKPLCDPHTKRIRGYEHDDELYAMLDEKKIPDFVGLLDDLYFFRKLDFGKGEFADDCILDQRQFTAAMLAYLDKKQQAGNKKRRNLAAFTGRLIGERKAALEAGPRHVPQADPGVVIRDNTFAERMAAVHAAKEDADYATAEEEAKEDSKAVKALPPRRRRGKIRPQADERELSHSRYIDWFGEMDHHDQEEVFRNVREKFEFFESLKKQFTRETHKTLRTLYWHCMHGCVQEGGRHVCRNPPEVPDKLDRDPDMPLARYLRLLAEHYETVSFTRRFNSKSLERLATSTYEEAVDLLEWLFISSHCQNPLWAKVQYAHYKVNQVVGQLYNKFCKPVLEYVKPYLPSVQTVLEFLGAYSFGAAIGTGIALLLGVPSGWSIVDKPRTKQAKKWKPDYLCQLYGKGYYRYVPYEDYESYCNAEISFVTEVEHVYDETKETIIDSVEKDIVNIPFYKAPVAQADWTPESRYKEARNKVEKNCYLMYFEGVPKDNPSGSFYSRHPCQLIFLGERIALIVDHARTAMDWQKDLRTDCYVNIALVPFGSNTHPRDTVIKHRWVDVIQHPNAKLASMDLAVIEFPTGEPHPRLERMIPPKVCMDYLSGKENLEGIFLQKPTSETLPDGDVRAIDVHFKLAGIVTYKDTLDISGPGGKVTKETIDYTYNAFSMSGKNSAFATVPGDCTSPGLITDNRKNICAMLYGYKQAAQPWLAYLHTSLHLSVPKGVPIYRELFQEYFDKMRLNVTPLKERLEATIADTERVFAKELGVAPQGDPIIIEYDGHHMDKIHTSELKLIYDLRLSSMSSIKRSPVFGIDPVTRYPARLHPFTNKETGEFLVPIKIAVEPYGTNNTVYNGPLTDAILHYTVARLFTDSDPDERAEVLSFEQCTLGDVGHYMPPMNWGTSPGFIMKLMVKRFNIPNPQGGSRFMVDESSRLLPQYDRILRQLVQLHIDSALRGDRIMSVNIDNLKDELLKKEKVKAGKTRLFCSSDKPILILFRMYFGAFTGWLFRNRIKNGFAVGINPYSTDWDAVYDHLDPAYKALFVDYGKFDKRQKERLMRIVQYASDRYYKDYGTDAQKIRHALLTELFNSVHIVFYDGELRIYSWDHGNTSGNFLTIWLNCLVNEGLVHLGGCYSQLLMNGYDPMTALPAHVNFDEVAKGLAFQIVGDDLVLSVRGKVVGYVNFQRFANIIGHYFGLEVTDELKTAGADVPPLRALTDGSLVGRKFAVGTYQGARKIWAVLRRYSAVEHVQWIKGVLDPEIEVAKFELLNLELCEDTREEFYSIVPRYAEECRKAYGKYPRFTDYDEARTRIMTFSSYRYSFETLFVEDTYLESDLFKLGLLTYDPTKLPPKVFKEESGRLLDASSTYSTEWVGIPVEGTDSLTVSLIKSDELQMDRTVTDFVSDTKETKQGTTLFVDSAPDVIGTVSKPTMMVSTYVEQEADIKAFLAKPVQLAAGQWTTSNAINTNLHTLDINTILTSKDMLYSKIKGFGLAKGDFVYKVVLNTSMFHQGKVFVHYLPCEQQFTAVNANFLKRTNKWISQKVQQPHIEIDCRKGAGAIRVPYIAPTHYWAVKEDSYDWGTIFLDVMSPLLTGAAAPAEQLIVDYVVYGYWENMELVAPTLPQSDKTERKMKMRNVVPEKAENQGPIEDGLRKVGKVANLMNGVPYLSDFSQPVSWVADIAANIASIWGWSKPRELDGTTVVTDQLYRYIGTSDGPDLAYPGGIICNNRVETIDYGSFTDVDEMSMEYLLSIPFYAGEVTWTAGVGQGYSLYSQKIAPSYFVDQHTDTVGAHSALYGVYSPLGYLANFFSYWRGDIEVTLKFPKTQLHSGRAQITWTPGTAVTTTPTISTAEYSMRTIVDIRLEDEITVVLPYMVLSDYLHTGAFNTPPYAYSGQLDIVVLNDLRAPESVSQSIAMQIFFRAGKNFEFAAPKAHMGPVVPYIPQSDPTEVLHTGGESMTMGKSAAGGVKTKHDETFHAARCIGEKIKSVKQLLLRAGPVLPLGISNLNNKAWTYYPWGLSAVQLVSGTGVPTYPLTGGDMYNWLVPMYAFYRGGMRVMGINVASQSSFGNYPGLTGGTATSAYNSSASQLCANQASTSTNVIATAAPAIPLWPAEPAVAQTTNGNYMYQHVPYYNKYPLSLTVQFNGLTTPLADDSQPRGTVSCSSSGAVAGSTLLQRAVADDFHTSFFIGCPPLMSK